jgi:hypothetical protein
MLLDGGGGLRLKLVDDPTEVLWRRQRRLNHRQPVGRRILKPVILIIIIVTPTTIAVVL